MLLAAIDIGSNAIRLFFSNVYEKNGIIVAEKASLLRIPIRLGEEVFTLGKIPSHKIEDLIKTMKAFKLLMEVYKPVAYKVCATSAMREACNRKAVIEKVEKKTGITIRIIDGIEEAEMVSGVQNLEELKDFSFSLYVDVGGGSTEISLLSKHGIVASESFKIGTVRLLKEKVKEKEWEHMQKWLLKHKDYFNSLLCIASGGNANKIAKLYGRLPENILPLANLEFAIQHLTSFSLKQRIDIMGLRPDRADVIVPAARIYHFIMKVLNSPYLLVPKIGLTDGIVTSLYREMGQQKNINRTPTNKNEIS